MHFSCQNVNVRFEARYDELEARNKNNPHPHLEIYPMPFFVNFETTFWATQLSTGRFRCYKCLHWTERIFLSRIHVSTSFWDVLMTTKTSNLFALKMHLASALVQSVLPPLCLNLGGARPHLLPHAGAPASVQPPRGRGARGQRALSGTSTTVGVNKGQLCQNI